MTGTCTGVGCRGCPCAFHAAARPRAREFARRRRARLLEQQLRTASRCPKRSGSYECGGRLRIDTDGNGGTVVVCELCERQKKGLCRECPKPIYGRRARRCRECAYRATRRSERAWFERNRDEALERDRKRYHQPEIRAARNEYKRQWRKANPEKVRAQKKRYVERHGGEASSAYLRYHTRYRRKHGAHYRAEQNARNAIARVERPVPSCTECGKSTGWTPIPGRPTGRPWSTCMRCAWPHQRKARRRVRREAAKLVAATALSTKPVKVRRPAKPAVRGPGFERLCITPGCEIVVTHRKKKCTRCRARDREMALQALAAHSGRGRRVDLERAS